MWQEFGCWYGLELYLEQHSNVVHYQAPLDRHPVPPSPTAMVCVTGSARVGPEGSVREANPYGLRSGLRLWTRALGFVLEHARLETWPR